jgi:predicted aspartyl protease
MRPGDRIQLAEGSLLLSFVLAVATAGFSQAVSDSSAYQPKPYRDIPFQMYRGYLIVVQGSLGASQNLNFVIDTGTDPSVIDSSVAQNLHLLEVAGTLAVHDQNVDVKQGVLPMLQVGGLRTGPLPVLIRDLAFLHKGLGIRIDAVIGLHVLSLSDFMVDYVTRRIVFGSVQLSSSAAASQSTPPWLTVRMELDGIPARLLVDTGASSIFLFQSCIFDRLPQLTKLGEAMSSNMGGEFRLKRVLLARTNLGRTDFGHQSAFLVAGQKDKSCDFDGLLGTSALGFKQVAFDFRRRTFSWKK